MWRVECRYIGFAGPKALLKQVISMMTEMLLTKRKLLGVATALGAAAPFASSSAFAQAAAEPAPKPDGSVDMEKALQPGPLPEMAIGPEDAKVTIIEYFSLTCPHCAHFAVTTFEPLKKKYVDTGKVRYIMREFPFDPRAAAAFMLSRCNPSDPSKLSGSKEYFAMVDVLFKQQQGWATAEDGRAALLQESKLAGFSEDTFKQCLTNQKLLDEINAVRERATNEFGINATPTFIINGKKYAGDMSLDQMSEIIDGMLKA